MSWIRHEDSLSFFHMYQEASHPLLINSSWKKLVEVRRDLEEHMSLTKVSIQSVDAVLFVSNLSIIPFARGFLADVAGTGLIT